MPSYSSRVFKFKSNSCWSIHSQMQPATICLGAAINHRIRRLFHPVTPPTRRAENGNYVSILKVQAHNLALLEGEIKMTTELAWPNSTGGIPIAFQQPRKNHPFERGSEAMIPDCEKLTVQDVFYNIVSCGPLNLFNQVLATLTSSHI